MREVEIDRAVYLVDDETGTYRFLRRRPSQRRLAYRLEDRRAFEAYARRRAGGSSRASRTANAVRGRR